eukprot:6202130-Pleurochrysis_carterae.AAC.2
MTLAVGRVKDNAAGQRKMLGDSIAAGIAAEIVELHNAGAIGIIVSEAEAVDSECGCLRVCHCKPVACLDLASARAMRACRGKAACMCGCQTLAALQSHPGNDTIPAIPLGNSLDTRRSAEAILRGACSCGTDLMIYTSLEAAGHVLPQAWSFKQDGAWACPHCKKVVWTSHEACGEAKAPLADLEPRAANEDDNARMELAKLMKEHADARMGAVYLDAPVVRVGTDSLIVDPMHCLELNLAKTAWKHSFGNRMLPPHRRAGS